MEGVMTQQEEIQELQEELKVCKGQLEELWVLRDELPEYATGTDLARQTKIARRCLMLGLGAAVLGLAAALFAVLR